MTRREESDDDLTIVHTGVEWNGGGPANRAYLMVLTGSSRGAMFALETSVTVIGRGDTAHIRLVEEGISREHARVRIEHGRVLLEDAGSRNGTWCNGERVETRSLADGDKIAIGGTTILKFSYQDQFDRLFAEQMFDAARRDSLTKLFKRTYFEERLLEEFAYAKRHDVPLSLIFIDIDRFKSINDRFGHPAGDRVLTEIARIVADNARPEDVPARYGGEELVMLARGLPAADAATVAERVRALVSDHRVEWQGDCLHVTVSIGVASLPAAGILRLEDLIATADRAMYAAKAGGRDQTVTVGDDGSYRRI